MDCLSYLSFKNRFPLFSDVNECKFGMCKNGKCVNTKGSFKCICDRGFDVDARGKACVGASVPEQIISPCC